MNTSSSILTRAESQSGLTLLETLIAAFILLFIMLSMISAYVFGRLSLEREEVKRKATAIAQDRLETVRARYAREQPVASQIAWDNIVAARIDTTYVVDGKTFTLVSAVDTDVGNTLKNVAVDVRWTAVRNNNTNVTRSIRARTSIGRVIGGAAG